MKTYMFPGQGCQFKGMGETLFDEFPAITQQADTILSYSIKELCLSDPERQLHQTQYTQPAVYVVNALSYLKKINETGELPAFLVGHSLGEYNALAAAGAITFEDGLKLVKKRGELMSQVSKGAMAAVLGLTVEAIREILCTNDLNGIDIANYNSPYQMVLSGLQEDIRKAEPYFSGEDIKYLPINTSGAFHSRYMEPIKREFEAYLKLFTFSSLKIPVISNVHARPYKQIDIALNLADQVTHSVKWLESILYLMGQATVEKDEMSFEELGVGEVLTKMIIQIQDQATPLIIEEPDDDKYTGNFDATSISEETSLLAKNTFTDASIPSATETVPGSYSSVDNNTLVDAIETGKRNDEQKEIEAFYKEIEDWNNTYPVGTKVTVEGYDSVLETRTKAMILFGHRAAIYMQGYNGYFALDEVIPA